jgi:hypothetical protein
MIGKVWRKLRCQANTTQSTTSALTSCSYYFILQSGRLRKQQPGAWHRFSRLKRRRRRISQEEERAIQPHLNDILVRAKRATKICWTVTMAGFENCEQAQRALRSKRRKRFAAAAALAVPARAVSLEKRKSATAGGCSVTTVMRVGKRTLLNLNGNERFTSGGAAPAELLHVLAAVTPPKANEKNFCRTRRGWGATVKAK